MRAAALDSVSILLRTRKSHGVLRALLPSLGNLIHDKTVKVRLSAVKMLLQVKNCPGIRFYHVVPVDHLMARFPTESKIHGRKRNPMTKELTALLLSSYFPQDQDMPANQLLQRTLSFLLTNPDAATVFYANLADFIEVESLVKFIIMLLKCLRTCVDSDQANQVKKSAKMKKRRRRANEDASDEGTENNSLGSLSTANAPLMASLADTINTLWDSLGRLINKSQHKACKRVLEERFLDKDCLVDIMAHFEQKGVECLTQRGNDDGSFDECFRTCSSILDCATRLDQKFTGKVVTFVMSSLKSLSKEESTTLVPLVTSYLSFLCASGYVEDVTESLASSIELHTMDEISLFNIDDTDGTQKRTRRNSSGPKTKELIVPHLSSTIAWGVLEYVLQGASNQGRSIRQAILCSKPATRKLEKSLEKGIKFSERLLADDAIARNFGNEEVEYAIRASEAYGRFGLHKESMSVLEKDDNTSMERQIGKLLLWTTKKVVPAFTRCDDEGVSALRDLDLSLISNRLSMSVEHELPGSPSLMSPPKQKANCGRTPEAMRGHSAMFVSSPNDSPVIYSAKVGSALLLSSCILSSEMLAMGMTNAHEIAKAALQWCQVFDQSRWPVEEQLLRAFIRLASQLFRASNDSTLLQELLVKCDSLFKEIEMKDLLKKELQSLLRLRNGCEQLLPTFFASSHCIIEKNNANISFESVDSSNDVWNAGGSIEIFLDAILATSGAAHLFAKAIVKKLLAHDGEINATINFDAKCLSLVLKQAGNPEIANVLEELDTEHDQKDGDMRLLVDNLLQCNA